MRFTCPTACSAALCLIVCFASATARALPAAEVNEAESAWADTYRANLLTLNEERAVGQRFAYLYAQRHTILKDATAQTRLNRVAAHLRAVTAVDDFNITIIKSARPEAVSFPPGYIFITSALLELACTDDGLAAVVAHELAHIKQRHMARLIGLSLTLPQSEREHFPTRSAIISGLVSRFAFPAVLEGTTLRYEMEADQLAVGWLERAGYLDTTLVMLLNSLAARISPEAQQEQAALRARVVMLNSLRSRSRL